MRPQRTDILTNGLEQRVPDLELLYRDLHEHPELSFQEERTASVMAARLSAAGLEVTTGVGKTGVVGVLRGGEGPTVLLRADMDALPVREVEKVPYRSRATGVDPDGVTTPVMHACGHDTHMTALVGAVEQLAAHRDAWSGTVLAVLQPAEEVGGGAQAMLDDGFLERFPRFDVALGQHIT
jgi:amidohydrolase